MTMVQGYSSCKRFIKGLGMQGLQGCRVEGEKSFQGKRLRDAPVYAPVFRDLGFRFMCARYHERAEQKHHVQAQRPGLASFGKSVEPVCLASQELPCFDFKTCSSDLELMVCSH